jgi:hypothetical protein
MCNPKTPRLLSYLIGDKVNIVTLRKDQAMAIREEYHAFRKRAVWFMGSAPVLLYLGMKRADYVVEEGDSLTLAPPLLTGARAGRERGTKEGKKGMASEMVYARHHK